MSWEACNKFLELEGGEKQTQSSCLAHLTPVAPLQVSVSLRVRRGGRQASDTMYSLEGRVLKLKLRYFGHLMRRTDSLEKDPDGGKD